jgi:hypothetical protein
MYAAKEETCWKDTRACWVVHVIPLARRIRATVPESRNTPARSSAPCSRNHPTMYSRMRGTVRLFSTCAVHVRVYV